MSVFGEDFDNAKPGQPGLYISPGDYDLELVKCKMIKNRKKEQHFAAEFEVIVSSNGTAPGAIVTYCVPMRFDGAHGDIKSFLAACTGESPENLKSKHAEAAVSEANPLGRDALKAKGEKVIRLRCNAWEKATKSGGKFTKTRWAQMPAA